MKIYNGLYFCAVLSPQRHCKTGKDVAECALASPGGGCDSTGSVASWQRRPGGQGRLGGHVEKPRPSGEKTMELGPGPRERHRAVSLTLQANARRSGAVPRPKGSSGCCAADTPPTSLSEASRSRQTTDQRRCFVAAWLMLILQKRSARRCPPAHFPTPPPCAWGPRLLRRKYPVPVLRAGTGLSQQDPYPPTRGTTKGTKVASGYPAAGAARGRITHG
jgi:hypothetical protein